MSQSPPLSRNAEFRWLIAASGLTTFGSRALAVVLGFQVYELTKSPLDLGLLGFIEALPGVTLILYGGHFADRHNRRNISLAGSASLSLLAAGLTALAGLVGAPSLWSVFAFAFAVGCIHAFRSPALSGLEAEIVPRDQAVEAGTWLATASQMTRIGGPVVAGFAYAGVGALGAYALVSLVYLAAVFAHLRLEPRPPAPHAAGIGAIQRIREGVAYVFSNQLLVGSMALDLLAVLFGGAMALLPIFATDLLQVGPAGFGLLNAAPAVGAFLMMAWCMRRPPRRKAGLWLHLAVAGFGLSMIVFGLSGSFVLSLIALALSGAFDAVSVVVRRAIIRLVAPPEMRGRISAVAMVFIGSSNEIGALESGVAAHYLGVRPAVWIGGVATLAVTLATARLAPRLFALDLEREQREAKA